MRAGGVSTDCAWVEKRHAGSVPTHPRATCERTGRMASRIRLVLTLHNHQPVGNFDGVFEEAFQDSYAPFLKTLDEFPGIRFSLHTSGSLLE